MPLTAALHSFLPYLSQQQDHHMNVSHLVPQSCSQAVGSPLTDSGYDSALTSPRPFTEPSGGSTPNAAAEAAGSQPAAAITEPPVIHRLGTIQGLQRFDTTLSNDTLLRFNDIQERIKGPLLACLRKTRKEFRPMAIRVVSLGHDQNSARPWIVVLCPDTVRKKIEKFFQSDLAMRLCKPNDTSLISFEVAVVGQPPREKAMEQNINVDVALMGVTTNDRPHWAFRVKVDHNQQNRFATMDGYVVVTDSTGTESIYGVTAGHVLVQDTHDGEQSYSDESMSSDEGTPDCPSWLDGRTTERDNTMDSAGNTEYNDDTFGTGLGETHQSTAQWSSLGQLSEASFSSKARNRDWALIENLNVPGFENSAPPLLVEKFYSRAIPISDNDFLRGVQFGFGPSHGFSSCTSCLPAILVLPYGTEFVNVNVLALGGDRKIPDGMSGCWILRDTTNSSSGRSITFYGQVVCDDIFGGIYVVPLVDIMNDIRDVLNASEVRLPRSSHELTFWLRRKSRTTIGESHVTVYRA